MAINPELLEELMEDVESTPKRSGLRLDAALPPHRERPEDVKITFRRGAVCIESDEARPVASPEQQARLDEIARLLGPRRDRSRDPRSTLEPANPKLVRGRGHLQSAG
jgi:hypothetical protein